MMTFILPWLPSGLSIGKCLGIACVPFAIKNCVATWRNAHKQPSQPHHTLHWGGVAKFAKTIAS